MCASQSTKSVLPYPLYVNRPAGGAKHMWLHERKGEGTLSTKQPLVWSYFTRKHGHVFANNGFIWGGDPLLNFTCVLPHVFVGIASRVQAIATPLTTRHANPPVFRKMWPSRRPRCLM